MKNDRNTSLDLISGVMILWMVVYHIFMWSNLKGSRLYQLLLQWLFFFMPWFYFKSGMYFKKNIDESIVSYFKNGFSKLFVPLFFWTLLGYIITIPVQVAWRHKPLLEIITSPLYNFIKSGDTIGNPPLWFLLSLFMVQLIAYYLAKIKDAASLLLLLLLFTGGYFLERSSVILPVGASTIPLGLTFYFLGYFFSKYSLSIKSEKLATFLLVVFVICNLYQWSYVDIHMNSIKYGSYISYLPMSIMAIMLCIYFSKFIKSDILSWAGKNSMYFFVLHWPILAAIEIMCSIFGISTTGYVFAFILAGTSFPLLFIITYFLPKNYIFLYNISKITKRPARMHVIMRL